jgi:hypothetical protein
MIGPCDGRLKSSGRAGSEARRYRSRRHNVAAVESRMPAQMFRRRHTDLMGLLTFIAFLAVMAVAIAITFRSSSRMRGWSLRERLRVTALPGTLLAAYLAIAFVWLGPSHEWIVPVGFLVASVLELLILSRRLQLSPTAVLGPGRRASNTVRPSSS